MTEQKSVILIVDDSASARETLIDALERVGTSIRVLGPRGEYGTCSPGGQASESETKRPPAGSTWRGLGPPGRTGTSRSCVAGGTRSVCNARGDGAGRDPLAARGAANV